jgi:hypothetical protein
MKSVLICNSCHEENPFYALNCSKCRSFLRPRISNIDLWQTTWKIFEAPVKTAVTIIQADHKNFVIVLLVLCCLKFSFIKSMVFNALKGHDMQIDTLSSSIFNGGLVFILGLLGFSLFMTLLNRTNGIQTRFIDNLSIYVYSFIPLLLGMLILVPINFALFGGYWFTFNPSPFILKPIAATVLIIIELLLFLWSIVIVMASTYAQSRNKIYSIISGIVMLLITFVIVYYIPIIF